MSKKLLLADDSVTIQRVIELTFSGEDVQVLTASDGEEAVARIAADKPDIVLADIGMPKRSGYDVSAFVKAKPELSHIPVLLLAGAFEPVDEAKAKKVLCDGVLVKPFEPQQVIARVRELIGGAKGSPTQPAVSDIPRPAAVLTAPRPVELPKREERVAVPEDRMEFGAEDLLPPPLRRSTEELLPADDFLPPVSSLESSVPPLVLDDSLDDYFDKLDEAFATITTSAPVDTSPAGTVAGHREGPVLERELDSFDELPPLESLPNASPAAGKVDPFGDLGALDALRPDDAAVPTLDDLLAGMGPGPQAAEISFDLAASSTAVAPPIVVASPPAVPPEMTPTLTAAPPSIEAAPATGRSIVADAFSALFAIEQGEPGVVPIRFGGYGAAPAITEPMIDDVARRVIQKLALGSSDQMQTLVRDIVSTVAERLVREEIDRIRRDAPRS
jgi:CheY-like chemotaxis protein